MDEVKKYVGYFKLIVNGMIAKDIAFTIAVELQFCGVVLMILSFVLWLLSYITIFIGTIFLIIPFLGLVIDLLAVVLFFAFQIGGFVIGIIGLILMLSPALLIIWPPTYRSAFLLKECCHPVFAVHFWGIFTIFWTVFVASTSGVLFFAIWLFSWMPGVLLICVVPIFPLVAGITVALTGWELDPAACKGKVSPKPQENIEKDEAIEVVEEV